MGQASSSLSSLDMQLLQGDELQAVAAGLLKVDGIWNLGFVQRIFLQYQHQGQVVDLTHLLPQECLASVFSKLSAEDRNACSLVCKRWHSIDAVARNCLTLKARVDLSRDLPAVLLRFEHVTFLSLKWHRKSPSIDDESLEIVGKLCKGLLRLNLKGCKALTDDGLDNFSKASSCLQVFSCASCGFGARGLNSILQNCSGLEDLSVKRLRRFIENPKVIVPGGGKLRRLSLKDLFNAQLFGSLIAGSRHLQSLVLVRNPGYWDRLFDLAIRSATELTELHCQSLQMGDGALRAIAYCAKLEVLNLIKPSDCTNLGICAVVAGCPNLKKLHVDDRKTNCLGDQGLFAVAERCTQLQELVLIGSDITPASLERIGNRCKGLERLVLCNSRAVGDREILCIAENFSFLKRLCIKNCPISDAALEALVTGCPSLTKVKIKKCKSVTRDATLWLQMSRTTLSVDMDEVTRVDEAEKQQSERENSRRLIRPPATLLTCSSRSSLLTSKFSLLKRFPKKSSCLPAAA